MDATEKMGAEVKARIFAADKLVLEKMARKRHLKVADIIREAIREKITNSKRAALV